MTCHAQLPYAQEARTLAHALCEDYAVTLFWIELHYAIFLTALYAPHAETLTRHAWARDRRVRA